MLNEEQRRVTARTLAHLRPIKVNAFITEPLLAGARAMKKGGIVAALASKRGLAYLHTISISPKRRNETL